MPLRLSYKTVYWFKQDCQYNCHYFSIPHMTFMKKIGMIGTLLMGAFLIFLSCDKEKVEGQSEESKINVTSILKITENIGDWDFAYIAPEGYYCYQENYTYSKAKKISTRGTADEESNLSVLNWQSPDGKYHATFTMDKETKLPVKLVTDKDIFNFVFLNDSILELVHETKDGVSTMSDSIFYNRALLIKTITAAYSNSLQQFAAYAKELLKDAMKDHPEARAICEMIAKLIEYKVVTVSSDNEEFNNLQLPVSGDGTYVFADQADTWVESNVMPEFFKISLWTGQAKFKVGGSSGSLDGSVICDAAGFNDYGTYGIIVDTDPANLTLEKASYKEEGLQADDKTSFEVNFRGFLPNTTYYYTTYFKFNSSDHGPFAFKSDATAAAEVMYADYKLFNTGDNYLSVDVVMCIDITGSMGGIIETVKQNAMSFYDQFNACCVKNGIELRQMRSEVIAFQDSADNLSNWLYRSPLYEMSTQQSEFDEFVGQLYADDGGDWAESGLEALDIAFSKDNWCPDDGYHRQIIILWTDAPYLKVLTGYSNLPELDFDTIPQYGLYRYDYGDGTFWEDSVCFYDIYTWEDWEYDEEADSSYIVIRTDTTFTDYFYMKYGLEYYYKYNQDYYDISNPYKYTTLTPEFLKRKWDAMPTGKRLILFAPIEDESYFYGELNAGSWNVFDDWKNVIHEGYNSSSFGDFEYILEAIVGELTGRERSAAPVRTYGSRFKEIVPTKNRYY